MLDLPYRLLYFIIKVAIRILRLFSPTLNDLFSRLAKSPGIPVPNPSVSYWMVPPSPISDHNSDDAIKLPTYADIVVIGSGITGTSFARAVLHENVRQEKAPSLEVVMLEARGACSGATGRNGGHITPVLYPHYASLKAEYGIELAKQIIRFRLAHLPLMLKVSAEENLSQDSQCREVEAFDVFHNADLYSQAKKMLSEYQNDLKQESLDYKIYEGPECVKALQLHEKTVGCFSTRGGALHPYRFVTGILGRLLDLYPRNFYLFTHTPCTGIRAFSGRLYQVVTPKGIIETRHIIHATNAWASHLLPGMRERILPAQGVMVAQIPRPRLGERAEGEHKWVGDRSFVFYPEKSIYVFDYLTQQPESSGNSKSVYPTPEGELMLGGGFMRKKTYLTQVGKVDDRDWDGNTAEYLTGAARNYFKGESADESEGTKRIWSGILGLSVDEMPWVGRVPESVSGRSVPGAMEKEGIPLAASGEWIAAGYTGEGMVHAWKCGEAVAGMVSGRADKELPRVFNMSKERWRRSGVEEMIVSMIKSN
ncbi:hypothetical protein AMATHDRAFT_150398 [Amanita thiersii Skay4041]|uniref:FAD dependent oxidoreductase domain-containing protein n=1 Tax=Amanita thiersii Skay4041 TaxID=703135 RepID=A0A2A9NKI6_9AGAR|nr:hypothetical protein AMATHDRAFT_150398 [Amanita thiersii Skay4041]